jgi:hypothetical protein
MVATAMIDRLIHDADILSLKGHSYRLRGKTWDPDQSPVPDPDPDTRPDRSARRHFRSVCSRSLRENPGGPTPQLA